MSDGRRGAKGGTLTSHTQVALSVTDVMFFLGVEGNKRSLEK